MRVQSLCSDLASKMGMLEQQLLQRLEMKEKVGAVIDG